MTEQVNKNHRLWDRQPGETMKAFYAFAYYRDTIAKDRSLRGTAKVLNIAFATVANWSTVHQWVERATAWDDQVDKKKQETRLKVVSDTAKRQARQTMAYVTALDRIGSEVARRLKEKPDTLMKFKDKEILDYLMTASKALPKLQESERTALGINPAFNVNLNVDLSKASDEELEQLASGKLR